MLEGKKVDVCRVRPALWLIFVLLLPYVMSCFLETSQTASAAEQQEVLENDFVKVTAESAAEHEQIKWTVHVTRKQTEQPTRVKVKIDAAGTGILTERLLYYEESNYENALEAGWIQQKHFSLEERTEDVSFLVSKKEMTPLEISVQIDRQEGKEADSSIQENLLTDEESGPYRLRQEETPEPSPQVAASSSEVPPASVEQQEAPEQESAPAPQAEMTENSQSADVSEEKTADSEKGKELAEPSELAEYGELELLSVPQIASPKTQHELPSAVQPEYRTDDKGTYPLHTWSADEHLLNHQGFKNGSWNTRSNSDDPYLHYGDSRDPEFSVAKYLEATETPGLFNVHEKIKGNTNRHIQPIDIMLVVDWSGSMMTNDRIGQAGAGINKFMDTLQESGITNQINIGYIGYSSQNDDGAMNGAIDLQPFASVYEDIKNFTPSATNEYGLTFTQKALRDAKQQLSQPNGHKKVLVLLTDGVPSESYKITELDESGQYGQRFSNQVVGLGTTSSLISYSESNGRTNDVRYKVPVSGYNYDPYGRVQRKRKLVTSNFPATIGEAQLVKESGIEIHGLGIQLDGDAWYNANRTHYWLEELTKSQVEEQMKMMVSASPDGQELYYESAEAASDISNYLTKKAVEIVGTVSNGSLTDKLSPHVFLEPDSLQIEMLGRKTPLPHQMIQENEIKLSNINLGKDQELYLHYQIRLDTESRDFVPETWYLVSESVDFKPFADAEAYPLQIPAVKGDGTTIAVEKKWEEFDGDQNARPEQLDFKVTRNGTIPWSATLQLTQEDHWKKANISRLFVDETGQETTLAKYNNHGEAFHYQVEEATQLPGYQGKKAEKGTRTIWTNTKVFQKLGLSVRKTSSDAGTPLIGAEFVLSGADFDSVKLTDQQDGTYILPEPLLDKGRTYTLIETKAPAGHEKAAKSWKIKVAENGQIQFDGRKCSATDGKLQVEVENPFKKAAVKLHKRSENGLDLAHAVFTLEKEIAGKWQTADEATTAPNGFASFEDLLPGNYRVKETKSPAGYRIAKQSYLFKIDAYGRITGDLENGVIEVTDQLKNIQLYITKKDQASQKPLGNVQFTIGERLEGGTIRQGTMSVTSDQQGKLDFSAYPIEIGKTYYLNETKTPASHVKLTGCFKLVFEQDDQGKVTGTIAYLGKERQSQDLQLDQTSDPETIFASFEITNSEKTPLPATGGIGRIPFLAISSLTLAVSGGYFYQRCRNRKEVA